MKNTTKIRNYFILFFLIFDMKTNFSKEKKEKNKIENEHQNNDIELDKTFTDLWSFRSKKKTKALK